MKRLLIAALAMAPILPAQFFDDDYRGGNRRNGPRGGGLQIIRAEYGSGHRFLDVTRVLRRYTQGDFLRIRVTNEALGGDPWVGRDKELRVLYALNGQQLQARVREYDELMLGNGGGWNNNGGWDRGYGNSGGYGRFDTLRILSARYGDDGRFIDVTRRLQSYVRGDRLHLRVDNYSMGGDPYVGEDKRLYLTYEFRGQRREVRVREGRDLNLPDF